MNTLIKKPMLFIRKPFVGLLVCLLAFANIAQAEKYAPDMLELNGGSGVYFEGHPAFDLNSVGTIEFWVAVDWKKDPGYDPVLLSSLGKNSANYVISILGDRSGISLQSGDFLADLPFNFADNLIHHVALINLDSGIMVVVDGRPIGEFVIDIPSEPSAHLWVGSAFNSTASFKGAIGGLRFWDVPLERKSIADYALQDVFNSEELHPDIASLTAISDFSNSTIAITDISDDSIEDEDVIGEGELATEEAAQ